MVEIRLSSCEQDESLGMLFLCHKWIQGLSSVHCRW